MVFIQQPIMPAVRQMKDFEILLSSNYEYIIMLDIHLARLKSIFQLANQHGKKLFLHADLIQGLHNDQYGTEFLCQEFKPYGLLSTKANVILKAKEKGVIAIQRIFLIDNNALSKSYALLEKTKPDFIEVLPAAVLMMTKEVMAQWKLQIPILAGGFIRTIEDVETALKLGAVTVTTSNRELWKHYEPPASAKAKK
ncbi:glycerol-3-phosphate responsive antiterminator [Paenibacillus sp. SAFN-117]|uniref:glycerol-3-phosphate responsive antiterminator n=1 Tax=Paenibacillus sp. SAFN-117 TaxID=3436860 RepID=UPI003F81EEF5